MAAPAPTRSPLAQLAPLCALALLAAALCAARIASSQSTAAHWDELALLARAKASLDTGVLQTGGRPGLAVLALLPFVRGCADELASLNAARLLWLGLVLAYLGGVAALAAAAQPERARRRGDAALAVALLALTPAFLEYSIQVRTDTLALAFGSWGAAALVASRRRPALALAAGALLGLGYLASQKAYYLAALGGLLAAGELLRRREWRPRREALRAAGLLGAYLAAVALERAWVGAWFSLPAGSSAREIVPSAEHLRSGVSHFEFFRNTLGWTQYRGWLPSLLPHGVLFAGLAAASARALWRRRARGSAAAGADPDADRGAASERAALLGAWGLLALGSAVLCFHGSRFAYFWLTLGLFPALALARARGLALAALAPGGLRARRLAAAGLAAALALQGGLHAASMLRDTQRVQRESLRFVQRNFARSDQGFLPESALYCRAPARRLPSFFSQDLYRRFTGPGRARQIAGLEARFRAAPVKYLLHSFRLRQFPPELRGFFAENYQPYYGSVSVAGRRLEGRRGDAQRFELIAAGDYRWIPFERPAPLEIDGRAIGAGAILALAPGPHEARFPEDGTAGLLVMSLADPPAEAPLAFYKPY